MTDIDTLKLQLEARGVIVTKRQRTLFVLVKPAPGRHAVEVTVKRRAGSAWWIFREATIAAKAVEHRGDPLYGLAAFALNRASVRLLHRRHWNALAALLLKGG